MKPFCLIPSLLVAAALAACSTPAPPAPSPAPAAPVAPTPSPAPPAPVAAAPVAAPPVVADPLSAVRQAQERLNQQGYAAGTADGLVGPKTRAALRRFQQEKGLKVTGVLDAATADKLNAR
ncbi:peptidoglycan-binding domain-containing protein [Curvibacter sp. RS43]|uniref:peptidoglycan-binding domain-containing protein n=1 Tax=Curvibacter microcysteis TaxID=3026419 RepID=UPI0023608D68|nr:peptidoglycan-binding domain-containing protein [Curvibacter sp. RS43]MDD0812485.1 peptidoglycan-binding domain-containing protein [Curvibacter sp. RS43]